MITLYFALYLLRTANGLPMPVMDDSLACKFADVRLTEIQTNFSHQGFTYHSNHDFRFNFWHEDLAQGFNGNEKLVFQAWENSPTHKQQLLSNMTGVCFKEVNNYWVMDGYGS